MLLKPEQLASLRCSYFPVKSNYACSTESFVSQSVSQSVIESVRRRLTNERFCEIFVFIISLLSSVFETRHCRYSFSMDRRLIWSTLNGFFSRARVW